ncbi:CopM family metallochaperone [Sphingomonas aurantiaca]|uniref:CopM family metallochaperone n=1 Tax=Sphingomonas aurantiaca TaxID=185949 RepID=UPI00244D2C3E|nr:DUF305 domain-containing protein [Sphingomonas aurantiaca]
MSALEKLMRLGIALLGIAALSVSTATLAQTDGFASAMDAAMARMHGAMMTGYSGNPDHDFAKMMIPHHQGAIDMAEVELRYGKDERLRRLAQGIIVEQRQEIAVMQGILSDDGALPPHTEPTATGHPHHGDRL